MNIDDLKENDIVIYTGTTIGTLKSNHIYKITKHWSPLKNKIYSRRKFIALKTLKNNPIGCAANLQDLKPFKGNKKTLEVLFNEK